MNVVLGNQPPLSISKAWCLLRWASSTVHDFGCLRLAVRRQKSYHWMFPILVGDGKIDYMFTTRGLQRVKWEGKHVIYEREAFG